VHIIIIIHHQDILPAMAAIISQLAAQKRARAKAGNSHNISSDKCVYSIPPFDPCFDPKVHNKYVRYETKHRINHMDLAN
jgi:hypothetical protein